MKKISIVGCGTIGGEVALAIDRGEIHLQLKYLYDVETQKAIDLRKNFEQIKPKIAESLTEAVSSSDLIFESTHAVKLKQIAEEVFQWKKDLFVMSVGGLIIYPEILERAISLKCKIFIPSGAISGLDGICALKLSEIQSVELKSTKPLKSLIDAPGFNEFIKSRNISPDEIYTAETIFVGNVREAVVLFPQNVNISAALALKGAGPDKTKVTIVADPYATKNVHEITCIGTAGSIYTRTENQPHPKNPKTSYLAILSAIANLKEL